MKTITKEYKIYNFEELTEEVQNKVIEEEKKSQEDDYCNMQLYDDVNYKAEQLLNEYFNIKNGVKNVMYDFSYSQGSGSMIEFEINIEDLNNKYHIYNDEEMRFIQDKGIVNNIEIFHNDNFYEHEYTFDIRYYDNFGWYDFEDIKDDYNINETDFNKLEDKLIDLLDTYNKHNTSSQFIKDIIDMNKELTKYGYSCIEYWWKDENVIDYCKQHTYYEDGEIYEY